MGAGRAQVLIWLRGLNLNLQAVVSSGIDIRALLIVGSRSQQIWEDSEHYGRNARRSWVLLSGLHLSRRHFVPPAQDYVRERLREERGFAMQRSGRGERCVDLT